MAHTFTGLKLQGQLGKFGKTEISDIEGYVELPDGKVLELGRTEPVEDICVARSSSVKEQCT